MSNELWHGGSEQFNNVDEIDLSKCKDSGYGKGFWLTEKYIVARRYALTSGDGIKGIITRLSLNVNIEDIPLLEPSESISLSINQLLERGVKVIKIWETDHSPSYSYRVVDLSVIDSVSASDSVTD